ncbi:LysR family transcriptional regulator [Roseobacter sinensis]|uniref:LysR family transcriptional regulator n=1 Tax=Roseobacter sinensis TaxID=2931391 RepID=A0ABT3BDT2_9RHOB|nr:LysR family transcriptional regulator [Roseobacter sp. WL0113]MCV3271707.1 LysR family transcriptional regulator [Roseobacter sp. WL0113]
MSLNWNDLRFVLETVRHGGLSGAARALKVNHATVSRRIAAAEAAMGARLFDRAPAGYRPTEAGLEAAEIAEQMEAKSHDLSRSLTARDQVLGGSLAVTAPQLLVDRLLAPILRDFKASYPAIDLSVIAANRTLNLAAHEADVAFRISDTPGDTLVGRRATEQAAAAYLSQDLAERMRQDPARPLDWIRFAHWPGPPEALKEAWPNRRVTLTVDDMYAALAAVRSGMGATRIPCFIGDSEPDLMRLPGVPLFPYRPLWVLTHADLRETRKVRTFTQFAASRINALRPLFEGRTRETPLSL